MVISIVCGLGTAVLFAASSLLSSRAVKIISPWSVVAWMMLVGLVVTLPFVLWSGIPADLSADDIGGLLATGFGNVSGLALAAVIAIIVVAVAALNVASALT